MSRQAKPLSLVGTAETSSDDAVEQPARVRLLRPHGFIDEYGQNRHWQQGEIVGDPAQVELLRARGAPVEALEE